MKRLIFIYLFAAGALATYGWLMCQNIDKLGKKLAALTEQQIKTSQILERNAEQLSYNVERNAKDYPSELNRFYGKRAQHLRHLTDSAATVSGDTLQRIYRALIDSVELYFKTEKALLREIQSTYTPEMPAQTTGAIQKSTWDTYQRGQIVLTGQAALKALDNIAQQQDFKFDHYLPYLSMENTCLSPQSTLNARVRLYGYSSMSANLQMYINDCPVGIQNGIAKLDTVFAQSGMATIKALITLRNPLTGETSVYLKTWEKQICQ